MRVEIIDIISASFLRAKLPDFASIHGQHRFVSEPTCRIVGKNLRIEPKFNGMDSMNRNHALRPGH